MSLGCFPAWDGPPEEDQLADRLSFHLFKIKLFKKDVYPPRHLPTSSSSCHGGISGTHCHPPPPCQEGFNISSHFHGLPELSWPSSSPPCTLGQVQLSWHLWAVAALSWKALAVLGFAKNWDLRSVSAKPRWHFLLPFSCRLLSMPWPAHRVGGSKSQSED